MKKKLFTRVLLALIGCTVLGTTIAYVLIQEDKPVMAFYVACCGGILVINFLISLFLVQKNFK